VTLYEIKEAADMAETFPGSGVLNWGEIGFKALSAWVAKFNWQMPTTGDGILTETFDVESVKAMFEDWWRKGG